MATQVTKGGAAVQVAATSGSLPSGYPPSGGGIAVYDSNKNNVSSSVSAANGWTDSFSGSGFFTVQAAANANGTPGTGYLIWNGQSGQGSAYGYFDLTAGAATAPKNLTAMVVF